MKNSNNTKRALFVSFASLVLCIFMLAGSSFAWFSDTVSTPITTIQAGNLAVDIETKDAADGWSAAQGATLGFVDKGGNAINSIKWEPGATYYLPDIRVANKGDIAFKYNLMLTGIDTASPLASAIKVTVTEDKEGEQPVFNGTLAKLAAVEGGVLKGILVPAGEAAESITNKPENYGIYSGNTNAYTFSFHMSEAAGKECFGLKLDELAFTIVAIQYEDSLSGMQDQNVFELKSNGYAVINNEANLKEVFEKGGKAILAEDIDLKDGLEVAKDADVILDLNGYTLSYASKKDGGNAAITNRGTLTITDSYYYGKITYSSTAPSANHIYSTDTIMNYGTLTVEDGIIENTTIGGSSNAIDNFQGSVLTVNGGQIITDNNISVRLFANDTSSDVNVTFNGGSVAGYGAVQVYAPINNAKATLDINGGSFVGSNYSVYTARANTTFNMSNLTVNVDNAVIVGDTYYHADIKGTRN